MPCSVKDVVVAGRLDVAAVALAGHSYGGATVTALCSQEPVFKCTVALDPWWSAPPALFPRHPPRPRPLLGAEPATALSNHRHVHL